jgi:hypothetical protein
MLLDLLLNFTSSVADLVLSNKLVVYDLEKEVIGWTDYNCKSQIHHGCPLPCRNLSL